MNITGVVLLEGFELQEETTSQPLKRAQTDSETVRQELCVCASTRQIVTRAFLLSWPLCRNVWRILRDRWPGQSHNKYLSIRQLHLLNWTECRSQGENGNTCVRPLIVKR